MSRTKIFRSHFGEPMSEYDLKAHNFLANTGVGIEITYKGVVDGFPFDPSDTMSHREYVVKLRRGHKSYTFKFYGSAFDVWNDKHPTKYDILSCLVVCNSADDLLEFCREFGYDPNDPNSEKIRKAVKKQSDKLTAFFSVEELEMLADIC